MDNLELRNNFDNIPKVRNKSTIADYFNEKPDSKIDNLLQSRVDDEELNANAPLLGRTRKLSEEDNTVRFLDRIARLTEDDINTNKPPLAGPEIDDLDEPDEIDGPSNNQPTHGIDDGFLTPEHKPDDDAESLDNDGEKPRNLPPPKPTTPRIPTAPSIPSGKPPGIDDGFLTPDPKPDDDAESEDSDVEKTFNSQPPKPRLPPTSPSIPPYKPPKYPTEGSYPIFPYAPGFGPGISNIPPGAIPYPQGGILGDDGIITLPNGQRVPDINVYQHKKTLAQGMMDLALFSANANQLRYVLESKSTHPYYLSSIFLISISLFLQVAVGAGLIWNSRYNVKDEKQICIANKINNFTIIGIFFITILNVFISAFGVAPPS